MNGPYRPLVCLGLASLLACLIFNTAAASCLRCPECNATCCELTLEEKIEKASCYEVKREKICIPNVVFPWQKKCCNPRANNGARVRTVKVMTKREYECPKCEYKWEAKDVGCGGGDCEMSVSESAYPDQPLEAMPIETNQRQAPLPLQAPTEAPNGVSREGDAVPAVIDKQELVVPSIRPTATRVHHRQDTASSPTSKAIPFRLLRALNRKVMLTK